MPFVIEFSQKFCTTHFNKTCMSHASFLDAKCCVCVYHHYYNLVHLLVLNVHRARISIACNSIFIAIQPLSGSFHIINVKMRPTLKTLLKQIQQQIIVLHQYCYNCDSERHTSNILRLEIGLTVYDFWLNCSESYLIIFFF